ncbi:glycosyltransferase family 2 protein [Marinomonas fungiae]|uniref:glycosyltransferase family 2 protein n=1 Tax=Marinomonas fungiae TaxID=1137284 RepID=UPI003A8D1E2D
MPKVSVIVRTKNRPDFLEDAVQSVLAQTYRPLELVVINDGGEDVFTLLKALVDTTDDVELNYVAHKQSQGRTQAANAGLLCATGELSIFLDDDDYFDPSHISKLVQAHISVFQDNNILGAVHCRARAVHIDGQGEEQLLSLQGGPLAQDQLFYQNLMPILTVLFPTRVRELGTTFDDSIDLFEDWDFWLQFNRVGHFHFIDEVTCAYRIHLNQSGAQEQAKQEAAYETIYSKWLPSLTHKELTLLLAKTHQWHELRIAVLQDQNTKELSRIGDLHSFALKTIADKDQDIAHLTRIYQRVEKECQEKEAALKSEQKKGLDYEHYQANLREKEREIQRLRRTHPLYFLYRCGKSVIHFCRDLFKRHN